MQEWNGVFTHPVAGIFIICVDDLLLVVSIEKQFKVWAQICSLVRFNEPAQPIDRYLGAHYDIDPFDPKNPERPRKVVTSMSDYIRKATDRVAA